MTLVWRGPRYKDLGFRVYTYKGSLSFGFWVSFGWGMENGGNWKVEGWKASLLGWEEKWEDIKCSSYKFTFMPLLYKKMVYKKFFFFFLIITNLQTNATNKTFINDRI